MKIQSRHAPSPRPGLRPAPRSFRSAIPCPRRIVVPALVLALLAGALPALANGGITFEDFAAREGSGIDYRRTPSRIQAIAERLERQPSMNFGHIVATPEKPRGAPGVALLDFDGDGDLDIYVTNGPGSANSLYSNQLEESGELGFVDVARKAGVEATSQDSTGVCYGDTDNDGDPDLLVLGRMEPNRFFENLGNGSFREAAKSGLGGSSYGHASCSMGDVDNDGFLDVAVANSFDWASRQAIFSVAYALNHPNQLFRNIGGNRFEDVSESSGIRVIRSVRPAIEEGATMSWAVSLVDYDLDGDVDLLHADDQAALSPEQADRAHVHVFQNDGTGHFENVTLDVGTDVYGAWMGLAFGDFNCDGKMDFFATNWGDYGFAPIGIPFQRGQWSSRWFLGQEDDTFADPGVGELQATPFGWSPMTLDYDNDGDTDVIYMGSLATAVYAILNDNPGAVLQNQGCQARFTYDSAAMTTVHSRRVVEGAASGDLDRNGFPDVVSASSLDIPAALEQKSFRLDYGSPFDANAVYTEFLDPAPGGNFVPRGLEFPNGRLVIDLNSGGNGNGWASVEPRGSVGLLEDGRVNRSGIGAVVRFHPEGLAPTLKPVMGGANYASQDSLETVFGMGGAKTATVEILWPGGTRNRLYGVQRGERVVMPEIPCSYDGQWAGAGEYRSCVESALRGLVQAGVVTAGQRERFLESALAAYAEAGAQPSPAPQEKGRPADGELRKGPPSGGAAGISTDPAMLRLYRILLP